MNKLKNRPEIVIGIIIAVLFIIDRIIIGWYEAKISLASYTCYVIFGDTVTALIAWMLGAYIIYKIVCKWKGEIELKHKPLICTGLAIVILVINLLTPLSNKFSGTVVDGKHPSRIEYYSLLIKDLIDKETDWVNVPAGEAYISIGKYKNRVGKIMRSFESFFINYKTRDGKLYAYRLLDREKQMYELMFETYKDYNRLTFYKNSGFVKTVNGAKLSDQKEVKTQIAVYKAITKDETSVTDEQK